MHMSVSCSFTILHIHNNIVQPWKLYVVDLLKSDRMPGKLTTCNVMYIIFPIKNYIIIPIKNYRVPYGAESKNEQANSWRLLLSEFRELCCHLASFTHLTHLILIP